jgi:capsular polysaccharide biosynthesis protein
MIDSSWRIEDPDPAEATVGSTANGFVSLHFLRAALRRRWPVWVAAAMAGLLLGAAWTAFVPGRTQGTVTLLLAHDPTADPAAAMATDVSLLRTRTVAASVVHALDLGMTPEAFQEQITATPETDSVLVVDVAAPDDAAGVARARTLARTYLDFRGTELSSQAKALIAGYQQKVHDLEAQASKLTQQYNALTASGADSQAQASEVLSQRTEVLGEVSRVQQLIEDTTLQSESVVQASHVLDPPSVVPRAPLKRAVLNVMAGLIAGLGIGVGLVLFRALTSDRLRRREEVALALEAPVRFSAGPISGRLTGWRRLLHSSPERNLSTLVGGLETAAATSKGRTARVALVVVDDVDAAATVVAGLAARLAVRDKKVFVVDLTEAGRLGAAVARALEREDPGQARASDPVVHRPDGPPAFALGPLGGTNRDEAAGDEPWRAAWARADVVLALAEADPAVGVDHLRSWVDRAVLLVSAGRSSAERVRTAGELVRGAGLQFLFALLVGTDGTDESSGLHDPVPDCAPARRSSR